MKTGNRKCFFRNKRKDMQQRKYFTVNNKEYIYDMFSIYCAYYHEHIHMYSHTTVNVMGLHVYL